ncbi:MAG: adenylate kinase [Pygmaiobacter massiliensis]|nr:adenylate kinase [Pygmaiobacter massiliensis]
MNIILLGAPGAGKGTMADLICQKLGIPVVGTGNIIREAVKNGTEMGKLAKDLIDKGQLLPDDMIMQIIKERLAQPDCKNGFILDGVPRTVAQAEAIEQLGIQIDKVIDLEVPDEVIVKRLTGRVVCVNCGASYHVTHNPSTDPERCDKCGGKLIARKDDEPATVLERLAVYHKLTEPLKDFYGPRGKLFPVVGQDEVADTAALVFQALEA